MKKTLVQLAYNPFLHSTAGTRNPHFGYPFHHYYLPQAEKRTTLVRPKLWFSLNHTLFQYTVRPDFYKENKNNFKNQTKSEKNTPSQELAILTLNNYGGLVNLSKTWIKYLQKTKNFNPKFQILVKIFPNFAFVVLVANTIIEKLWNQNIIKVLSFSKRPFLIILFYISKIKIQFWLY